MDIIRPFLQLYNIYENSVKRECNNLFKISTFFPSAQGTKTDIEKGLKISCSSGLKRGVRRRQNSQNFKGNGGSTGQFANRLAMTRFLFVGTPLPGCPFIAAEKLPQSPTVTARCGEPGRGSDSPPGCHSLPRLRFAYPQNEGVEILPYKGFQKGIRIATSLRSSQQHGFSVLRKSHQVCVILNAVKNLRMEWVLSIDDCGKIFDLLSLAQDDTLFR